MLKSIKAFEECLFSKYGLGLVQGHKYRALSHYLVINELLSLLTIELNKVPKVLKSKIN